MRVFIALLLSISLLFNGLNILCLEKYVTFDHLLYLFDLQLSFFKEKETPIFWSEEGRPLTREQSLKPNKRETPYRVRAGPINET